MSQTKDSFDNAANNNSDSVMRVENGNKVWRNAKSQPHRTDGPAIEWADGDRWWCLNGQRHRTDGPAIEYADGGKRWYLNDRLHRTDGPAIERADGHKVWFLNDKQLTEQEFNAHPLVQEAQRQKEAASQAEAKSRRFRALLKLAR